MLVEGLIRDGDRARDRRDWTRAATAYRDALACDPTLSSIWVQYGHALKESGDLVAAEAAYRRSIGLADGVADTHLQLGHVLKLQSRYEKARDAYFAALSRDERLVDAREELVGLGWSTTQIDQRLAESAIPVPATAPHQIAPRIALALEVTDLVHHLLAHGPILSGIQRVQFAVMRELLDSKGKANLAVITYVGERRHWVAIPPRLTRDLMMADRGGTAWGLMLRELRLECAAGQPFSFEPSTALLNLGTSWWLPDYFLALRNTRETSRVRLYHFIHDLVPVLYPEFCLPDLVPAFLPWLVELGMHADRFLVNSRTTGNDLARVFDTLGLALPPLTLVQLEGLAAGTAVDPAAPARSLSELGIDGDFILFVSTFEPRKNHLFVFAAWRRLLSERGLASTPLLVCVGRRDWMFDEINRARVADPSLDQRIRILNDVSDPELVELYHQCRFIIYPSRYEGWGLPVSEALRHGKVPLVARVAALPEAGGEFAEYFDLTDADDFDRKLCRLMDDATYREAREREIAAGYRPISAAEVVQELVEVVASDGWSVLPTGRLCGAAPLSSPLLPLDIYLPLSRNREMELLHVVSSGTIYRMGSGWEPPDEQGCRLRGSDALLRMRLAGSGPHLLYLFCASSFDCELGISVDAAPGGELYCAITGQGRRCIPVRLAPDHSGECTVRLRVEADSGSSRRDAHPDFSALRLIGLYACREADARSRQRFFEHVALDELPALTRSVMTASE